MRFKKFTTRQLKDMVSNLNFFSDSIAAICKEVDSSLGTTYTIEGIKKEIGQRVVDGDDD